MIWLVVYLAFVYLAVNIFLQLWHNTKAHKFFKAETLKMPILPSPNIVFGHALQTIWDPKNHEIMFDWHKKLGRSFAFYVGEQPWLSTTDLDLIKAVFDKHNNRLKWGVPYEDFNNSMIQVNDEKWRRVRRSVSPTMTNLKVRGEAITSDIMDIVDQLNRSLINRAKNSPELDSSFEVDSMHTAKRVACATIIYVSYKKNHVIDFESDRDPWIDELTETFKAFANPLLLGTMLFPFIEPATRFIINSHKYGKQLKKIVEFTRSAAELEEAAKEHELLDKETQDKVLRRVGDEIADAYLAKKISFDEVKGSLLAMFVAGYETVATTIAFMIYQLAMNPDKQEKLRAEIAEKDIDSDYLHWCINETIRLMPPIPLGAGRVLDYDIEHKGSIIPKGTFVTASIYCVHYDPEIWPNPKKFEPERWANWKDCHPASFLGFGYGPRNCVGGKLGMHEIKLVFKMFMENYRIEKCAATPDIYRFISPVLIFTEPEDKIKVRIVPLKPINH